MNRPFLALAAATLAAPALAQSNIDAANRDCWGENLGFLNWRDTVVPVDEWGADIRYANLGGAIWAENAGWIKLGVTGGDACGKYANATGLDFGVNIAPGGDLSGLAWGETIGWVNFNTAGVLTPDGLSSGRARLDRSASPFRLRGYAWSETAGWINLDNSAVFVAQRTPSCCADADGNGRCEPADVACFINLWFASLQNATLDGDFDNDGSVSPVDVALFIQKWLACINGNSCTCP